MAAIIYFLNTWVLNDPAKSPKIEWGRVYANPESIP